MSPPGHKKSGKWKRPSIGTEWKRNVNPLVKKIEGAAVILIGSEKKLHKIVCHVQRLIFFENRGR